MRKSGGGSRRCARQGAKSGRQGGRGQNRRNEGKEPGHRKPGRKATPGPPGARSRGPGAPMPEQRTGGGREPKAGPDRGPQGRSEERQATKRRRGPPEGAATPPPCRTSSEPGPRERPRQGPPRGPQCAKRTAATRPTARPRHSASARATRPPWAGRPSAADRRRKLGGGIAHVSSANGGQFAAVCARIVGQWLSLAMIARPGSDCQRHGASEPKAVPRKADANRRPLKQSSGAPPAEGLARPGSPMGYRAAERRDGANRFPPRRWYHAAARACPQRGPLEPLQRPRSFT